MIVRITLASNIGADLGPFNLTANAGSVVPNTATRAQLLGGLNVTASNSATTVTATSTGSCTNGVTMTITSIPVYVSNITSSLDSDPSSIGDVRVQYTRTSDNEVVTLIISDTSNAADQSQIGYITNAKAGSIVVSVNKYSAGTTLQVGTGAAQPSVTLIVNVNGSDVANQTVNNGSLTANHTLTHNEGDIIQITGILSTD
jgi:hypothetical protein